MLHSGRRDFLRAILGGAAGLSLSAGAFGQAAPSPITATKLADRLVLLAGDGGNVLVVISGDGLMLIDGGLPERSAELLQSVSQVDSHPIRTLFNTHWHFDHTGCNQFLGKMGTKIIAHENTKKWLSQMVNVEAVNRTFDPMAPEGRPVETFAYGGKMTFGTERLDYNHVSPAHTDSDVYVYFPTSNVLHSGDLFFNGSYPMIDYSTGGWVGGMAAACDVLLRIGDAKTRIVPGHGPIATKEDLRTTRNMLWSVTRRMEELHKQDKTLDEAVRMVPTKGFDDKYGGGLLMPETWTRIAYTSVLRHEKKVV
jgi:glyoxylase-like metal-dependent hydrolase (beta-lactamase superfamily II)